MTSVSDEPRTARAGPCHARAADGDSGGVPFPGGPHAGANGRLWAQQPGPGAQGQRYRTAAWPIPDHLVQRWARSHRGRWLGTGQP